MLTRRGLSIRLSALGKGSAGAFRREPRTDFDRPLLAPSVGVYPERVAENDRLIVETFAV